MGQGTMELVGSFAERVSERASEWKEEKKRKASVDGVNLVLWAH